MENIPFNQQIDLPESRYLVGEILKSGHTCGNRAFKKQIERLIEPVLRNQSASAPGTRREEVPLETSRKIIRFPLCRSSLERLLGLPRMVSKSSEYLHLTFFRRWLSLISGDRLRYRTEDFPIYSKIADQIEALPTGIGKFHVSHLSEKLTQVFHRSLRFPNLWTQDMSSLHEEFVSIRRSYPRSSPCVRKQS